MDSESADSSFPPPAKVSVVETPAKSSAIEPPAPIVFAQDNSSHESPSTLPSSGLSSWARNIKLPQALASVQDTSQAGNTVRSTLARLASGFGFHLPAKDFRPNDNAENIPTAAQSSVFESIAKGLVDSSISTVKAVQIKARHAVSQNKRRYQEGGFDLDMTYITENIIAMGFPAGDMSSGFFGYVEGFYRNHMEEVIKFFETHHKGNYKVYNLCSERLYDASLFEGKVASFPFDDHNCPPLQLITSFCQSAYSWLKEDILNVVVVHCKAGMARTGLMISSLLFFLKLFPTAGECINYYNRKRCVDGKALILPSQIRYVKYFERFLTYFNGESQPGRRCMLRGFRVHKCPYWIRPTITISDHNGIRFSTKKHPKTKDLTPEDFWIRPPKKGFVIFALPGEPGVTELMGDFKIHFHDRQGDFYCWLNTTMIENRIILNPSDLDGFDERKLPSPGFQIEIVMIDYDGTTPTRNKTGHAKTESDVKPVKASAATEGVATSNQNKIPGNHDNDDVFSDSEGEETPSSNSRQTQAAPRKPGPRSEQVRTSTQGTKPLNLERKLSGANPYNEMKTDGVERSASGTILDTDVSDIKAIAADASVFSFGDEEDFESE